MAKIPARNETVLASKTKPVAMQIKYHFMRLPWGVNTMRLEIDDFNLTQATYTYGNLLSQRRNSTTYYYHTDALGSTRELTGASAPTTSPTPEKLK